MGRYDTPRLTFMLVETCPLRTTRYFVSFKKIHKSFGKFPDILL